jgi:hypothetical protein
MGARGLLKWVKFEPQDEADTVTTEEVDSARKLVVKHMTYVSALGTEVPLSPLTEEETKLLVDFLDRMPHNGKEVVSPNKSFKPF